MIFLIILLLSLDTMVIGINLKEEKIEIKFKNIILLSFTSIVFVVFFHYFYRIFLSKISPYFLGLLFLIIGLIYLIKYILIFLKKHRKTFDFNKNKKINFLECIILSIAISFDNACYLSLYQLNYFYIIYLFILNIIFIKIGIELRKKIKWESLLELFPIIIFFYLSLTYFF